MQQPEPDGDLSRTPLKLWRKYHKLMHLMG